MYEITTTLGKYLASVGYKGIFGCDFLINKAGKLVVVDLNPRHQGGYACNGLAMEKIGLELTDIELATLLNVNLNLSQEKLDAYLGFAWAHSKLVPPAKDAVIRNEYQLGSFEEPFTHIGSIFMSEFYQQGSIFKAGYVGYQLQTEKDYAALRTNMLSAKEAFNSQVLG